MNPQELTGYCLACKEERTLVRIGGDEDAHYCCKPCRTVQYIPWLAGANMSRLLDNGMEV